MSVHGHTVFILLASNTSPHPTTAAAAAGFDGIREMIPTAIVTGYCEAEYARAMLAV